MEDEEFGIGTVKMALLDRSEAGTRVEVDTHCFDGRQRPCIWSELFCKLQGDLIERVGVWKEGKGKWGCKRSDGKGGG